MTGFTNYIRKMEATDDINRRSWQPLESKSFLNAYLRRKDEFLHSRKKKYAMQNVLEDLEAQGVLSQHTTVRMLNDKMKNLLRAYKYAIDAGKKSGSWFSNGRNIWIKSNNRECPEIVMQFPSDSVPVSKTETHFGL